MQLPKRDPSLDGAPYNPDPRAHPGLHVIALFEAIKGFLALIAASGLAITGPDPVRHFVWTLIRRFNIDARHGIAAWADQIVSPTGVHIAVAIVFGYGLLHIAEGWGLWRDKAWASWLGCVGVAAYLPFDLYALVRHPAHWLAWGVVVLNLVILYVLARDLIKRHRHPPVVQPGD